MTPPVPTPPKSKFGRQKVLIAGAGLVLVVFLFLRSRTPAADPARAAAQELWSRSGVTSEVWSVVDVTSAPE